MRKIIIILFICLSMLSIIIYKLTLEKEEYITRINELIDTVALLKDKNLEIMIELQEYQENEYMKNKEEI